MYQKRHLMMALGLCLLLPVHALGGTARHLALGGDSAYFSDPSNVLQWYASLELYPDLAVVEGGDIIHNQDGALSDQGQIGHGGGAHLQLDSADRWGTVAFYVQDHLAKGSQDGAFFLLYAHRLGPWRLGLAGRFTTYGVAHNATGSGDYVDGQYFHQYGMGLSRSFSDHWQGEVAGEIINTNIDFADALHEISSDTWQSYGLRLRLRGRLTSRLTLVPLLAHNQRREGNFSNILSGTADLDADLTTLGLGLNLQRNVKTLVIISGEYRYGNQDWQLRKVRNQAENWTSSGENFYQIRGRVAVEYTLLPWLTVRAAAHYIRRHEEIARLGPGETEDIPHSTEAYFKETAVTPVSFGLGLQKGSLRLDLAYNDTDPVNPGLVGEDFLLGHKGGYSALSVQWLLGE